MGIVVDECMDELLLGVEVCIMLVVVIIDVFGQFELSLGVMGGVEFFVVISIDGYQFIDQEVFMDGFD